MISASASASIERLFEKAIRANSVAGEADACVLTWRTAVGEPAESRQRRLVVLNVASYLFRLVVLFDFGTDAATAAHMARLSRSAEREIADQALLDAFAELANVIVGEVNRGLSAKFRHAGMSTPFVLESSCAQYVSALAPAKVWAADVAIDRSVCFQVGICLCLGADTDLDFHIEQPKHEEAATGELELF